MSNAIPSYGSIADLRSATTPANGSLVEAKNSYDQAALYYYNANATDAEDGVSAIKPASGTGRYLVRDVNGALDVRWFAKHDLRNEMGQTLGSKYASLPDPYAAASADYPAIAPDNWHGVVNVVGDKDDWRTLYVGWAALQSAIDASILRQKVCQLPPFQIKVNRHLDWGWDGVQGANSNHYSATIVGATNKGPFSPSEKNPSSGIVMQAPVPVTGEQQLAILVVRQSLSRMHRLENLTLTAGQNLGTAVNARTGQETASVARFGLLITTLSGSQNTYRDLGIHGCDTAIAATAGGIIPIATVSANPSQWTCTMAGPDSNGKYRVASVDNVTAANGGSGYFIPPPVAPQYTGSVSNATSEGHAKFMAVLNAAGSVVAVRVLDGGRYAFGENPSINPEPPKPNGLVVDPGRNWEFNTFENVSSFNCKRFFWMLPGTGQALYNNFDHASLNVVTGGTAFEIGDGLGGYGLTLTNVNCSAGEGSSQLRRKTTFLRSLGSDHPVTVRGGRLEHFTTLYEARGGSTSGGGARFEGMVSVDMSSGYVYRVVSARSDSVAPYTEIVLDAPANQNLNGETGNHTLTNWSPWHFQGGDDHIQLLTRLGENNGDGLRATGYLEVGSIHGENGDVAADSMDRRVATQAEIAAMGLPPGGPSAPSWVDSEQRLHVILFGNTNSANVQKLLTNGYLGVDFPALILREANSGTMAVTLDDVQLSGSANLSNNTFRVSNGTFSGLSGNVQITLNNARINAWKGMKWQLAQGANVSSRNSYFRPKTGATNQGIVFFNETSRSLRNLSGPQPGRAINLLKYSDFGVNTLANEEGGGSGTNLGTLSGGAWVLRGTGSTGRLRRRKAGILNEGANAKQSGEAVEVNLSAGAGVYQDIKLNSRGDSTKFGSGASGGEIYYRGVFLFGAGNWRVSLVASTSESWVYDSRSIFSEGATDEIEVNLAMIGGNGVDNSPADGTTYPRLLIENLDNAARNFVVLRQSASDRREWTHVPNFGSQVVGTNGNWPDSWTSVPNLMATGIMRFPAIRDHVGRSTDDLGNPWAVAGQAYYSTDAKALFISNGSQSAGSYKQVRVDDLSLITGSVGSVSLSLSDAVLQKISGLTAAVTIALPASSTDLRVPKGRKFRFVRDASNGVQTVSITGTGLSGLTLNTDARWQEVVWDGTSWIPCGSGSN